VQEQLLLRASGAASSLPTMGWEAELAECVLILHKAELQEGDSCTPGLSLLFEDPAFAKLAKNSVRVKRARERLQSLQTERAAELEGKNICVGSDFFKQLLAAYLVYKVGLLKTELAQQAMHYAELQALMPALAERSKEQARILKALEKVVRCIDAKVLALQGWLTGPFVDPSLLPPIVTSLREGCSNWDPQRYHRGEFPWFAEGDAPPEMMSNAELLAALELRILEHQRAREELELIEKDKLSALKLYGVQCRALQSALHDLRYGQPAEFLAECVHTSAFLNRLELRNKGMQAILEGKLKSIQEQHSHAEQVFGSFGSMQLQDPPMSAILHSSNMHLEVYDSDSSEGGL
jgi:hypothetical protein